MWNGLCVDRRLVLVTCVLMLPAVILKLQPSEEGAGLLPDNTGVFEAGA